MPAPPSAPAAPAEPAQPARPSAPTEPATPYVAVDLPTLDRNVARMARSAAERGLRLRPHVKTHKCPEIARRQVGAGATGITVATVAEAEVFVAAGFGDVFVAYPLWLDAARGARLRSLLERATLRIGVDSFAGAEQAARCTAGAVRPLEVLVEVDSGHHRTGVAAEQAGQVAVAAARAGLEVRGVFTFPGHGYGPGRTEQAAADEARALAAAAASLRAEGIEPSVVSGGSTPTAEHSDAAVLTEIRPGVYVFGDAQQLELGVCQVADVALTVAATVVSRAADRFVVDAGSKVLGADRAAWATGFGRLADDLGEVVRIVPNHVCAAVNLADELVVVAEGAVVDRWRVAARGANT